MYVRRKIESTILNYLGKPEIIAIVGPRQCGKTTLLQHIYGNLQKRSVFLTFEDKKVLDLFEFDIDSFISTYIKPNECVFIDEFQYAQKGGKLLKYVYDTNQGKTKIFLSGSSSIDLTVQAVKYLVGRIFIFSLFPFDFEEYLDFKDKRSAEYYHLNKINLAASSFTAPAYPLNPGMDKLFAEYSIYGGYPRVVLSETREEKQEVLKNIYNTYFLREIKDILGLIDDYKLAKMIKGLALQIGNLIDYSELGRLSDLTYPTVKKYLNFLEKTFICVFPRPYFKNKRTEIVKNPKVYFLDPGLRNYIVNDFRPLDGREDGGALLENAAAMQIIKSERSFNFWRSKQKEEVDFVLEKAEGKRIALEVKSSLSPADLSSRSSKEFRSSYPDIPLIYLYLQKKQEISGFPAFPIFLL
ncbi:MAG: ATP-binding protein [Candidatus Margulisiibacteriota bacterium]